MEASRAPIVVLTGGPCAGKTTALEQISSKLEALGVRVFLLPESATLMFGAGCPFPAGGTPHEMTVWEAAKLRLQEAMEDEFIAVANAGTSPTLILCDRGMMDSKAYCASRDDWMDVLEENGWTEGRLMNRYDAIVHMVSTAHGAEEVYTRDLTNNVARRESTVDEARGVDNRVQAAWKNHTGLAVVDNSTGWEDKLARTFDAVVSSPRCQSLLPESVRNARLYRKKAERSQSGVRPSSRDCGSPTMTYLVTQGDGMEVLPNVDAGEFTDITYTFLDGEDRTLKRTVHGQTNTYVLSTWREDSGSAAPKGSWSTQRLSKAAYRHLLIQVNPELSAVHVRRYNHIINAQLVTLDLVSTESTDSQPTLQLLSFRGRASQFEHFPMWREKLGLQDVSQDPAYCTRRSLARHLKTAQPKVIETA